MCIAPNTQGGTNSPISKNQADNCAFSYSTDIYGFVNQTHFRNSV